MARTSAIGVDLGGTNVRAARVSASGEIFDWIAEPTAGSADLVIEQIRALVRSLSDGGARAVGIGLPGRIDRQSGKILSGGYIDLTGRSLDSLLGDTFAGPVFLDNDGNMALVGEQAVGGGRGVADVIMLTIGTGIGGAVFSNGKIFRGGGTAGHLGHVTVDFNGEQCLCGRRGCVETTSSGTALRRHIERAGLNPDTAVSDIIARAARGDAGCKDVLMRWAMPLRMAIDSLVAAFSPELVLLGGGLGAAAHQALSAYAAVSPWFQCPVRPAKLGERAGVIGAGLSALALLNKA